MSEIPDDPIACMEDRHFVKARERLFAGVCEIPFEKIPGTAISDQFLYERKKLEHLLPVLHNRQLSEQRGRVEIQLEAMMRVSDDGRGILELSDWNTPVEENRRIIPINPKLTKPILNRLSGKQRIAVMRFVYADRAKDLEHEYRKAVSRGEGYQKVELRQDNLAQAYRWIMGDLLDGRKRAQQE